MKEMNVFKAGCYQNFFNAPIKNYQLVANWTSLDHDLVKYKRVFRHGGRCQNSTVMAELQNDNLVSKPTRVLDDLEKGIRGSVPIPPDDAGKEAVIESLVTNVRAMIAADRKITALKQLQGHIWRTGFQSNELQGVVYEDVPEALKKWHADGIKVYIYSSGSRESQRLIFGNTTYGDLRKYLNKKEPHSYFEISQSVGVDEPSQVLFLTDVYQEAVAAKAADLIISRLLLDLTRDD
ncbi:HAD hydrolase subfamily IA protein [Dioscorea alata]|uniref:HAD hydrolase subfamily IA protein n=1 Tax=Dioscorea alata TaxID=55571 RepID=A0ACB7V9Q8_DIOAL|nr:HAD hydrolase subfamily IA protein [Dioscorea alata]